VALAAIAGVVGVADRAHERALEPDVGKHALAGHELQLFDDLFSSGLAIATKMRSCRSAQAKLVNDGDIAKSARSVSFHQSDWTMPARPLSAERLQCLELGAGPGR
jgi:hypothetical protein